MPRHFTLAGAALLIGWSIVGLHGCKFPSADAISDTSLAVPPSEVRMRIPPSCQTELNRALELCEAAQKHWEKGESEHALSALDQAYATLLSVEGDSESLVQQKEDLRFLISKRILEIYASRNTVAAGKHNAIPRGINDSIQDEINKLTGPEKQFFINSCQRAGRYRPMIVQKLEAAGLPTELSWLPLIESGFRAEAISPARALGLWQFIPSTGYKFGLERNAHVDQRMDFEKSTDAAIAYLRELHGMFGDWSTVLAAYNCGEGRVLNVIRSQNVNYLDDFWDLYKRLPYETARYVPRFLATVHIIENAEKYGLSEVVPEAPLVFETVTIQREVHLKDVASALGVPVAALETLNPELRYQILPPTPYTLRVPQGKSASTLAAIDTIPVSALPPPSPPKPALVVHKVKKGETLSGIAKRYKTNVNQLAALNRLGASRRIVIGQTLKVSKSGGSAAASPRTAGTPARASNLRHVVKNGDSLWNLAQRYNTTVAEIQKANNLSTTTINIDQSLRIPAPASPPDKSTARTYAVKKGESASLIAQKHNIPLDRFLKMNNLTTTSTIRPGQIVRVN